MNQSRTAESDSSAGSCRARRSPAISSTVSMSKTRTGVMGAANRKVPRSAGEHAGRQVTVAAIADDEHDRRVLDLARDAQRDCAGAARRNAAEDAFLAGKT